MNKPIPITIIVALTTGLIAQFIWKMIYFPEPILPVIFELIFIITAAGVAIQMIAKQELK